jgi:hypothetical protein
MEMTLLGATALVLGLQSFLHSVCQFSPQTICTENKMGNQGAGFLHYVGNINNNPNVNQFLDIDKPFWVWASRIAFKQTAVATCQYRTDPPLIGQRAMERALYI